MCRNDKIEMMTMQKDGTVIIVKRVMIRNDGTLCLSICLDHKKNKDKVSLKKNECVNGK